MLSHRDGARVVAGAHLYPAVTLMKLFEVMMESLTSGGVELQRANLIATTAVHFVFGNVIEEQASPTPEEIRAFLDNADIHTDYPLMMTSVQQTFKEAMNGYDEFEDALRLIIHT
jgi:TetR/AcrR family tetracycline transcriptional repressor